MNNQESANQRDHSPLLKEHVLKSLPDNASEDSRLHIELNRRIDLLSKLFLASSLDDKLDLRINQMIDVLRELLDADYCAIYVKSSTGKQMILTHSCKDSSCVKLPTRFGLERSALSREVMLRRKPIVVNSPDPRFDQSQFKRNGVRNCASAPIVVNGRSYGVVNVINKSAGNFDAEDVEALTIAAYRIGAKLENAQLIQNVKSEKNRFTSIIEHIREGMVEVDDNHRIQIWNRYLEELTGIDSAQAIGRPCYKIIGQRLGLRRLSHFIYDAQHHGCTSSDAIEEHLRHDDGSASWVSASVSPLPGHSNTHIRGLAIVIRDVSREKELIETKNEFVSLTTHELRTPLTAIKGYLSMILQGDSGELNSKQYQYFYKAYRSTERLVNLVEDLLQVIRIEERRLTFVMAEFYVNDLVAEVVEEFAEKANVKKITLSVACDLTVANADREKTKHIIENLVDNAIKYTKEGGKVVLKSSGNNESVVVSVKDTGVGIPIKHLDSVFERFTRVSNSLSIKAGGTGLGLYIVKNLTESQGGTIWVESTPSKGTTFFFTLPIVTKKKAKT